MQTRVRVLYWKEIPVQVEAENASGKVSLPLDARFQEAADAIAMFDGSYGSDAYLDAWQWGESFPATQPDTGKAAKSVAEHYNTGMPTDFVARIRDLHNAGTRTACPGSIDEWIE